MQVSEYMLSYNWQLSQVHHVPFTVADLDKFVSV